MVRLLGARHPQKPNSSGTASGARGFLPTMRANGTGPYLLMVPTEGTQLEYFDKDYPAYIHSARQGNHEALGMWRQKHSSIVLESDRKTNESVTYGFNFTWGQDYDGIREALYQNGGFDIHVIPGMTVPSDLSARFSLRTKNIIRYVSHFD